MPQLPLAALALEEEIEQIVEERLIIQADRSFFRTQVDCCTEKLKRLRDRYLELEQALQDVLFPSPVVFAT